VYTLIQVLSVQYTNQIDPWSVLSQVSSLHCVLYWHWKYFVPVGIQSLGCRGDNAILEDHVRRTSHRMPYIDLSERDCIVYTLIRVLK